MEIIRTGGDLTPAPGLQLSDKYAVQTALKAHQTGDILHPVELAPDEEPIAHLQAVAPNVAPTIPDTDRAPEVANVPYGPIGRLALGAAAHTGTVLGHAERVGRNIMTNLAQDWANLRALHHVINQDRPRTSEPNPLQEIGRSLRPVGDFLSHSGLYGGAHHYDAARERHFRRPLRSEVMRSMVADIPAGIQQPVREFWHDLRPALARGLSPRQRWNLLSENMEDRSARLNEAMDHYVAVPLETMAIAVARGVQDVWRIVQPNPRLSWATRVQRARDVAGRMQQFINIRRAVHEDQRTAFSNWLDGHLPARANDFYRHLPTLWEAGRQRLQLAFSPAVRAQREEALIAHLPIPDGLDHTPEFYARMRELHDQIAAQINAILDSVRPHVEAQMARQASKEAALAGHDSGQSLLPEEVAARYREQLITLLLETDSLNKVTEARLQPLVDQLQLDALTNAALRSLVRERYLQERAARQPLNRALRWASQRWEARPSFSANFERAAAFVGDPILDRIGVLGGHPDRLAVSLGPIVGTPEHEARQQVLLQAFNTRIQQLHTDLRKVIDLKPLDDRIDAEQTFQSNQRAIMERYAAYAEHPAMVEAFTAAQSALTASHRRQVGLEAQRAELIARIPEMRQRVREREQALRMQYSTEPNGQVLSPLSRMAATQLWHEQHLNPAQRLRAAVARRQRAANARPVRALRAPRFGPALRQWFASASRYELTPEERARALATTRGEIHHTVFGSPDYRRHFRELWDQQGHQPLSDEAYDDIHVEALRLAQLDYAERELVRRRPLARLWRRIGRYASRRASTVQTSRTNQDQ